MFSKDIIRILLGMMSSLLLILLILLFSYGEFCSWEGYPFALFIVWFSHQLIMMLLLKKTILQRNTEKRK